MHELFLDFECGVATSYEWTPFDSRGRRLPRVPSTGLLSLDTPTAVEHAWNRWEYRGRGTGPVLRAIGPDARRYRPMAREHATLFNTFGALDYRDRDAIRAFAARYGLLGIPTRAGLGESHLAWAWEICQMSEALDSLRVRTAEERDAERARAVKYGLDPAWRELERRERLAWLFNVHLQHVRSRFVLGADGPSRLSHAPGTLLAAMWLQLALAVAGDKRFLACKFCGRLFEISTDQSGFRSHREFCTASCKTQDYRRRKRTARELAKSGMPVTEIAKSLDTNKVTVRGWVGRKGAR